MEKKSTVVVFLFLPGGQHSASAGPFLFPWRRRGAFCVAALVVDGEHLQALKECQGVLGGGKRSLREAPSSTFSFFGSNPQDCIQDSPEKR